MELNIQTSRTFTDIQNGPRIVILQGGTRSGKSYSAVQWLIVKALQEPNLMISIVRKSFPSLRISALRDFKEIMNGLGMWFEDSWRASENTYNFHNGSMIEFLSVQDSERRKGTKRDYLFIDEANELDYEDFFQLFIRTTHRTILAYNPSFPPQTHWITQNTHKHPDAKVFISTYNDNPFLEETIVQEIERLKMTSPSYWTIYGTGEFGMVEGLIFDNFSITDSLPDGLQLLGYGMDFGFTNDETACVALWKGEDGIYLDEMFYMKGLFSADIIRMLRGCFEIYGKGLVIGDSADPRMLEEIYRGGINIKKADKGRDSILVGIDIMKQQRIYITKSSKHLIDEFYSYQWLKDKANNVVNEPDPRSKDHAIDASRYICMEMLSTKKTNVGTYTISII